MAVQEKVMVELKESRIGDGNPEFLCWHCYDLDKSLDF